MSGPTTESQSVAEKILRVQALWDEIAAEANEVDLTDEERGELDRRLSAYLRDPGHVVTWTDARNHVRGRRR